MYSSCYFHRCPYYDIPKPVALFPLRVSNRLLLKLEFLSSNRDLYIHFKIIQPALEMYSMGCNGSPGPTLSFGNEPGPKRLTGNHRACLSAFAHLAS